MSIDNGWMVSNGHATGNNSEHRDHPIGNRLLTQDGEQRDKPQGRDHGIGRHGHLRRRGADRTNRQPPTSRDHAPVATGGYSPLLMFSNAGSPPACNVNAIQFSGNGISWNGLMYAPRGEIQMSSSSNVSVFGSIIAHSVDVSGSDFSINWQDDSFRDTPLHSRAPELTARSAGPVEKGDLLGGERRSREDGDLVE